MTLQEKYGDKVRKRAQESKKYWEEMEKEIREDLAPNIGDAINSILDKSIETYLSSTEYRLVPRRIYSIYYRINVGDSCSMSKISLVYSCSSAEVAEGTVGAHSKKFSVKKPLISSEYLDRTHYRNCLYEAIFAYLKSEYAIESTEDNNINPLPFIATVKFS